jgi:hypothetical protein
MAMTSIPSFFILLGNNLTFNGIMGKCANGWNVKSYLAYYFVVSIIPKWSTWPGIQKKYKKWAAVQIS